MNRINFTPPPRTEFQYRSEMMSHVTDATKKAYAQGFLKGEIVGQELEFANRKATIRGAIFLGFVYGVAACATVIALYVGWRL